MEHAGDLLMRRRKYLQTLGVGGAVALSGCLQQQLPSDESSPERDEDLWREYQFDPGRTSYNLHAKVPTDQISERWIFKPELEVTGSPVVAEETVLVADGWNIYAVGRSDGDVQWKETFGEMTDYPCFGSLSFALYDETVFVGTCYGVKAFALSDGAEQWRNEQFESAGDTKPTIHNDTIFINHGPELYGLRVDTGEVSEKHSIDDAGIESAPAIHGESIYASIRTREENPEGRAIETGGIAAIDRTNGTERWRFTATEGSVLPVVPTVRNGMVYAPGGTERTEYSDSLVALDTATGDVLWRSQTENELTESPAVTGDAVFAVTSENGKGMVHSFDIADGSDRWQTPINGSIWSGPAVTDETVVITSDNNKVYALNAETGEKRWRHQTDGGNDGTVPVIVDGTVYIASGDLYALSA